MADIFISYAKVDRPKVEPLAKALKEQGWSVWWDPRIRGGQHFDRVIEEALSNARCIVVIWSHKSVDSSWVRAEAAEGLEREILVPVIIEQGVKLPIQFRYIQTDELIEWDSEKPSTDFAKLLEDIKEIIDTPSVVTGSAKSKKASRPKELPKEFRNSIRMNFVLIPAGNFMMGSKISPEEYLQKYGGRADWYEDEHPQHEVTISKAYQIQSTTVTQGQWKKVMGKNPSKFRDCGDDCPVERVSWDDVQKFIKKLNKIEETDNYRLPTEAEWEYACRAGTTSDFSFGDDVSKLGEYAWYMDNSEKRSHPVATKKPNPWGLYDMHGNVWEWCQDWSGDYSSGPVVDPTGPPYGQYRVLRGGSWNYNQVDARCALRFRDIPHYRTNYIGFRCTKTVK